MSWTRVKDVRAFLADKGAKRIGPHVMNKRILSWVACSRCGLLGLKNDATRRALLAPCVTYEEKS